MIFKNPYINSKELFKINRLDSSSMQISADFIRFNSEYANSNKADKIFVGLFNPTKTNGIALSINQQNGEIEDLLNGQGIIGYVISVSLKYNKLIKISVNIEKYGNVFLPILSVDKEKILHPALYIDDQNSLQAFIGNVSSNKKIQQNSKTSNNESVIKEKIIA